MSSSSRPSWTTLFAWTTGVWLTLSVLLAALEGPVRTASARGWVWAWVYTVPRWTSGLTLTLAVFAVARAAPAWERRPLRASAVHLGAGLVLTVLGAGMQQALWRALNPGTAHWSYEEGVATVLRDLGPLFLMLYAGLVGIYHAVEQARNPASREEVENANEDRRGDTSAKPSTDPDHLLVRTGDALVPVPVGDIEWIEAADSYVRLHCRDGTTHLHRASMTAMADRLADRGLLRVHRSTIVRIDAVERVETPAAHDHYAVRLRDGTQRRVSSRYRDALLDALGASM